jgi:hypothetical protein
MESDKAMNTYRTTAIVAGSLFITATVATSISQIIMMPILGDAEVLESVYTQKNRFVLGILLELVNALASAGIAISLFPVLRRRVEGLAVGYVGFRVIEGAIGIVAALSFLSLLTLSQDYAAVAEPLASGFQSQTAFIRAAHDWAFVIVLIVFSLGALMLYPILYQSRLVPRLLSVWGFVGALMLLTSNLLILFGLTSTGSTLDIISSLPIAVNEMALALWLIVKGFDPSAVAGDISKSQK